MNFTKEQIQIIEKNRPYYNELKESGTMTRISSVTVEQFQKIYMDAIGGKKFSISCPACIVELIELVYANYDQYKDERKKKIARPKQTA